MKKSKYLSHELSVLLKECDYPQYMNIGEFMEFHYNDQPKNIRERHIFPDDPDNISIVLDLIRPKRDDVLDWFRSYKKIHLYSIVSEGKWLVRISHVNKLFPPLESKDDIIFDSWEEAIDYGISEVINKWL